MNAVIEMLPSLTGKNKEERRKFVVEQMIENGQQVPLTKLFSAKQVQQLDVKQHVLKRFKQRFSKKYDIEIETEIKSLLLKNAMVVGKGHSDRWIVHAQGHIFILDERNIFTTYDANGNDKNNILDPTKQELKKARKKTRNLDRMNELFKAIGSN